MDETTQAGSARISSGRAKPGAARRYVRWIAGLVAAASGSVFAINMIVDPLWTSGGNKLTGINYAFNERLSKSNLLLAEPRRWNCVILGSSRTTLLDARRIASHRCFNYAVSQGSLDDFEVLLEYFARWSGSPDMVLVGVDGYQFGVQAPETAYSLPPFLREGGRPPDLLASQLSIDTLDFSLRTLRRRPPNDRYYDRDFVTRVVPGAGPWRPPQQIEIGPRERKSGFTPLPPGPFRPEATERLTRLRELAPRARLVGYAPPVNAWYAAELWKRGTLDSYLATLEAAAAHFDAFFDFTAPSELTRDPSLTYDGQHFEPEANDRVAETLNDGGGPLALAVHELVGPRYRERFARLVENFVALTPIRFSDP